MKQDSKKHLRLGAGSPVHRWLYLLFQWILLSKPAPILLNQISKAMTTGEKLNQEIKEFLGHNDLNEVRDCMMRLLRLAHSSPESDTDTHEDRAHQWFVVEDVLTFLDNLELSLLTE